MECFRLQTYLDNIYASYPEAAPRPLIGITSNYTGGDATLRDKYYKQTAAAGGIPVIIPPVNDKNVIINTLEHLDGLILSGGGDYNPLWCGEEPSPGLHGINAERDLPELLITRLAYNRQIPMLGICRGIQTLAMALGGRVAQDIGESLASARTGARPIKHSQDAEQPEPTHSIYIKEGSTLHTLYNNTCIYVNSFHHQAVADCGKRFSIAATSPDGIIEAIESSEHKPIMGVQWHPEWMASGLPLFRWLVRQAGLYHKARQIHKQTLTLDTHCDTPMFFPQDIHFEQRDPRILVDMHKMSEGHLDAVTMVAYLPQPKAGEPFRSVVPADVSGPAGYADLIFDKIEDIVSKNSLHIAIARTPEELYSNKRKGVKSILLGIENGLALEGDISNLAHFAERGITYMTLCHNGDNDICDSAKGSGTHGGVSAFGEKVIQEMNRLGIMVDLSHGGERSFYDALDISSTPVVCSHSNCRALCDVPRNLTDDQLRALAAKGGVAHTTLYGGFLRTTGEASVIDALSHLEHAIEIMGIDHVGLGTDFDGDGGVSGLADASELINFTMHLLRRRYSKLDIRKIWGGNWLRVMRTVQDSRGAF